MTKTEILKAIRKHCNDCMGNQEYLVRECPCKPGESFECNLWPFRLGRDPEKNENRAEAARKRYYERGGFGGKND